MKPKYRIALRPDEQGAKVDESTLLDDIVVNDVPMFRAEQMTRSSWWVACYLNGNDRICWNVQARGKPLRLEWTVSEWPEEPVVYEDDLTPEAGADGSQP